MVAETKDAGDRRPVQAQRRKRALREFLVGASLVVLLVLAKTYFEEKTGLGQELKHEIYNLLQWKLATGSTGASVVTIVDITDVKGEATTVDGEMRSVTPRQRILDLLKMIDSCGPRAIGVDVDFSPFNGKLITDKDEEFFRKCREFRTPIFLGIKRTQERPPETWLYKKEFSDLAATIVVPRKELENEKDSITKMPFWLESRESEKSSRRWRCPSMSAALSDKSWEPSSIPFCQWLWSREVKPRLRLAEFPVDWSAIEDLKNNSIAAASIAQPVPWQIRRRLEKHIVFLGDITPQSANDVFIVQEKLEPGVLLHACAAETLTSASGPLVELTDTGRFLLDVVVAAGLILGSILGICLFYSRVDPSREVNVDWLQRILTRSAIVVILIVGFFFVHRTRLLWDDFLFVALALVLHRPVERCLATCSGKVPAVLAAVMRWWNKRVLRPKQNPD
jgi:CHASE2 domain-containing sensor protein